MTDDRLLTDDEWKELVNERDAFKLAIRGQTAIEAEIDAAIEDAFVGPMPKELRPTAVRFELRLALLVGLGVIPPEWRPLFAALSRLRNDFAHGKIRELDAARGRELLDATRVLPRADPLIETLIDSLHTEPLIALTYTLLTALGAVQAVARITKDVREQERQIVAQHRSGVSPLLAAVMAARDMETARDSSSVDDTPDVG